ncbi:hypothetical protein [Gloeocapsa sp. PCC 73106]|uniref:hypothetical protein n=1 Tax=Gloeocapsa sp. PCC 73106 TaxID=102232 RepID=UPI0002AC7C01|nr:hypothetical protein [Gloeocapsa sp. PCC 73106]ELR99199.1 hypothetical protein GLO73106DRAFT_00030480 [Gloeocapsa sp. PCC 73106]
MTTTPEYSKTDLILATSATTFTGLSVIMAEFNLFSTVLEVITFTQEVFNAKEKYPNNSLIQAMTNSFGQIMAEQNTVKEAELIQPIERDLEKQNSLTILGFTGNLLNNVFNGLSEKVPPAELQEFKEFLYRLGESIANAAGEGTFGTGTKISVSEAKALEQLKVWLGLTE